MDIKEIAVLGGGNGSLTMAGDMSLAGYNVRMWTAFPQEFKTLYKTKTVKLRGLGRQGDAKINLVNRELIRLGNTLLIFKNINLVGV